MKLRRPLRLGLLRLSLLAIVVGIITGFGAVAFRALIGLIHNIAFLGSFSLEYDANVFTPPSPWGAFVILVPVVGGLIVTFLVTISRPKRAAMACRKSWTRSTTAKGVIRPIVAADQVAGLGVSIGTRRRGRPRGSDHPDRRLARLDPRPDHPHGAVAAHHAGRGRRRRRHRRDLQHADRRRHVRHRADDAGGERRAPSCRWRWRPAPPRSSAASFSAIQPAFDVPTRCSAITIAGGASALLLYALARRADRRRRRRLHPRPAVWPRTSSNASPTAICATPSAC